MQGSREEYFKILIVSSCRAEVQLNSNSLYLKKCWCRAASRTLIMNSKPRAKNYHCICNVQHFQ